MVNIFEERAVLKSYYKSPKWTRRVNEMDDQQVIETLELLRQQMNELRKIA